LREINALMSGNVREFDDAFWSHIGHVVRNVFRSVLLSVTRGRLASVPGSGRLAVWQRKLSWASATFAFLADIALGSYGGALKMKEKLAGRYADVLSWMFLATATMRRYESENRTQEDKALFEWAMQHAFYRMQTAFDEIYSEIQVPGLGWLFRGPVALWSRMNRIGKKPSDALGHQVAQMMQTHGEQRNHMTHGIYFTDDRAEGLGKLEYALSAITHAHPVYKILYKATKSKVLQRGPVLKQLEAALEKQIITPEQADQVRIAEAARYDAITVDEFTLEEYNRNAIRDEEIPGTESEKIAEAIF
jgi:Domain of unknown function (DUF1974).